MKRETKTIHLKFGTFELTKKDLADLEKLILRNVTLTDHSDHYIRLGKMNKYFEYDHTESSTRYIRGRHRAYHHAQIKVIAPNILIDFMPHRTDVFVVREFYKGTVLQQQAAVAKEIEKYFVAKSRQGRLIAKLLRRNNISI